MGREQRRRGAEGEREAAVAVTQHLGVPAERSARNGVKGASDLQTAMRGWNWEVKRRKKAAVDRLLTHAQVDAGAEFQGNNAVLLVRVDRGEWIMSIRLADLPQFVRDWRAVVDIK
jgi:hypothetical protein